ncbi:MAG: hypothetical protein IT529_20810 [Burkholderiales bacterium]|nr:hypothetical protein [Burkholderiales bacterium]
MFSTGQTSFAAGSRHRAKALTSTGVITAALCVVSAGAGAGVTSSTTLAGGDRWDAAPRELTGSNGFGERSLAGGLRYNMQGGSYESFRNLFTWNVTPTVSQFQTTVEQAFRAWESVDPASGFGTSIRFVWDPATQVKGISTGHGSFSREGAEIDLFGATTAFSWNAGSSGRQGETSVGVFSTFDMPNVRVTLTSGTTNYAGTRAISGADIILNSNPQAIWSLDLFRRVLTHEIGHALGLYDTDVGTVRFIDDNYSAANPAGTLNNSWAAQVNPLDPAASPLSVYTNPSVGTAGVNLLMEHFNLGISTGNPVTSLVPLTNDEFGVRQFLYPELAPVPEPRTYALVLAGLAAVLGSARLRKSAKA